MIPRDTSKCNLICHCRNTPSIRYHCQSIIINNQFDDLACEKSFSMLNISL